MKELKVLFLPTNVSGVNFYRLKQFSDCMASKGIDTVVYKYSLDQRLIGEWECKFSKDNAIRTEIYRLLRYCTVAVIGYLHHPKMLPLLAMFQERKNKEVMIHTRGPKKFIAEIDDWILDTPDYNPAFKSGWKPGNDNERIIIEHLKMSNAVVSSTDFLAREHRKFNRKSFTVPNAIDFKRWNVENKKNKRMRIGWIGGFNHEEDLRILEKVVRVILKKYKDLDFYFVHGAPRYIRSIGHRCKWDDRWASIDKYPQRLADYGFDIGLAPLEENKFNYGKSNLKWLEYSALKIPTIATKIEPYRKSIKHMKTGLLSNNIGEWIDNISLLIENEDLRHRIGENAYLQVKKEFNLNSVTDRYIKILRRL